MCLGDQDDLGRTYLGFRVTVLGGRGIPLGHQLTGRARIRTVRVRLARLVGAHGPASILGVGRDGYQAGIRRELTLFVASFEARSLGHAGAALHHGRTRHRAMLVLMLLPLEVRMLMSTTVACCRGRRKEQDGAESAAEREISRPHRI